MRRGREKESEGAKGSSTGRAQEAGVERGHLKNKVAEIVSTPGAVNRGCGG